MKEIFLLVLISNTFKIGEKFVYTIEKSFFTDALRLGEATLKFKGITDVRGTKCYHFVFEVRSDIKIALENSHFLQIYVCNRGESFCCVENFTTLQFKKYIEEKYPAKNRKKERTVIEVDKSRIYYSDGSKIEIPSPTKIRDQLAIVWWLRTKDLKKDSLISTTSLAEDQKKLYKLQIKNHGLEKIKVPFGEYDCFKLEFLMKETGLFKIDDNMFIWFSQDEKIPIMMHLEGLIFKLKKIEK